MSESLRDRAADPFDLLLELERRLRAARRDGGAGESLWSGLGVRIDRYRCVLPRADVREVIPQAALTRVPGARPWLLGLANVRGSLLPVFDLRLLAELPAGEDQRGTRVLVFNSEQVPAGFVVDEVYGQRQFSPAEQAPRHARADSPLAPWLLGAFERDGEVWLALSLHRLVASERFVRTAQ